MSAGPCWTGSASRFLDVEAVAKLPPKGPHLNVLLLADDAFPSAVVRDHIAEIRRLSRHRITVVNPKAESGGASVLQLLPHLPEADAILIHYSVFVFLQDHIPEPYQRLIARFRGPVVQIIQDEYRRIDEVAGRIARMGVGTLFSSLIPENATQVYRHAALRDLVVVSSLPGYVPDRLRSLAAPAIAERRVHLVHRGRPLPYWLGRVAHEKLAIAEHGRRLAKRFALTADISTASNDRFAGDDWYGFLSSSKAMLAAAGGASVFDFDGTIEARVKAYLAEHPGAEFEDVNRTVLADAEGRIDHRTITPRMFEAAATRTALVLHPGAYRGVLEPWRHYVPLAPDGSNDDEVAARLRDDGFLQALVDRTHAEIIASGRWSFVPYVAAIDHALQQPGQSGRLRTTPRQRKWQIVAEAFRSEPWRFGRQLVHGTLRSGDRLARSVLPERHYRALRTRLAQLLKR